MIAGVALSGWDWGLVGVVAIQGTVMAYIHHPFWKAMVVNLPLPFTLAILSLGFAPDAASAAGMCLLPWFFHAIRLMRRAGCPILGAIAVTLFGHITASSYLAGVLPRTEAWMALCLALAAAQGVLLHRWYVPEPEAGYRTGLPVWIKLPAMVGVSLSIVLMKTWLQGCMAAFPMVSVIAAYECRHLLGSLCGQIPFILRIILPMMLTIHLAAPYLGCGWALIPGWGVFLAVGLPQVLRRSARIAAPKLPQSMDASCPSLQ